MSRPSSSIPVATLWLEQSLWADSIHVLPFDSCVIKLQMRCHFFLVICLLSRGLKLYWIWFYTLAILQFTAFIYRCVHTYRCVCVHIYMFALLTKCVSLYIRAVLQTDPETVRVMCHWIPRDHLLFLPYSCPLSLLFCKHHVILSSK